MRNPWLDLSSSAPFVLEIDRGTIEGFNRKARPEHLIRLEIVPEPFLGSPEAPVVLLNLNPGFTKDDLHLHKSESFVESSFRCLRHEPQEYPFYLLDPSNDGPGRRWWNRKLRPLIERFGAKKVANQVLCIEWFGYHSVKFGGAKLRVPSQEYSFQLMREALKRNALVVAMRSLRLWTSSVPELADADAFTLRSVQNPTISEGNCDRFGEIVEALEKAR